MTGRPTFVLDAREVRFEPGETILGAARREGADIPTLCHEDGLGATASCRLCIVEVASGGPSRVVTSCDYPLREGLQVVTRSPRLSRLRKLVMALHVARAPGSRRLREMAERMGADVTGLRPARPDELCILCGLCVRACAELAGAHALCFAGRGARRIVTLAFGEDDASACIGCGACAHVCPTGCIEVETLAIDRLRQGSPRPCRYALMGLVAGATCAQDYRCATCALEHEMVALAGGRHPAFLAVAEKP